MLFLFMLVFVLPSKVVSDVGTNIQHDLPVMDEKKITRRSDGTMPELVNQLAEKKVYLKEIRKIISRMVQQNANILNQFAALSEQAQKVKSQIKTLKTKADIKNGAVYIRWGRTDCASNDTKLVYSGYAAGAHFSHQAGTNTQCLPKNPNWRKFDDNENIAARIYGAEYELRGYSTKETLNTEFLEYEVPCAVCQSTKRLNAHMIPAKDRCGNGWHLEYRGYLMTQHYHHAASDYVCVDADAERIGSNANYNGRLFYPVESICGSLPCPPYVNHRELTCAVCTY